MNISKNLTGILAALSIGCAGSSANRHEDGLTREHYTLNYDATPEETAIQLYVLDHSGERPSHRIQLAEYMWSPKDLNLNGVLDFHADVTITRRGNTVMEVYERITTLRQASNTGRDEFSEHRLTRNANGTYTQNIRNTAVSVDAANLELAIGNYKNGIFAHNLETTGRLIERLWSNNGSEQRPNARPRLHNY